MLEEIIRDEKAEISPAEYFNTIKGKQKDIDDEKLNEFYNNCLKLVNKYKVTGQKAALKRLMFYIECIERERKAINAGLTTYVERDDIDEYIDHVAKNVVKCIELSRFERDIPDDVVDKIAKVDGIFDELYVFFTDYTGREERKVEKERREKDPIIFGVFLDKTNRVINNRFYFIADWVDEYCDLTLDRMISEMKSNSKNMNIYSIATPDDLSKIKEDLSPKSKNYHIDNNSWRTVDLSTITDAAGN